MHNFMYTMVFTIIFDILLLTILAARMSKKYWIVFFTLYCSCIVIFSQLNIIANPLKYGNNTFVTMLEPTELHFC